MTSWRTSRPRLAPIARRMPISFCRLDARASSMLATLAHAISSTRPTTRHQPGGDRHDDRIRDGMKVHVARRLQRQTAPLVRDRVRRLEARHQQRQVRRAPGRSSFPGFSRARTNSQRSARRSRRVVPVGDGTVSCMPTGSTSSDADTGIHISGDSTGTMPLKPDGATPTIVYGLPRMRMRAADDVGRRPELARPVAMRHHRHARRRRHVVVRQDRAAERGRDAEDAGSSCR